MAQASNREQWRKRVQRWKDSGLTAREFADETGLNFYTLRSWSSRLRCEERAKGSTKEAAPKSEFIEVTDKLSGATSSAHESELQLVVSDLVVRVPAGFDEQTLRQVLSVIRQP
jgi:hypothetical protein